MDIPQLVREIHGSGHKAVMAIAGGGAGAVDELLKRGGGSAILLEAVIPYAQESFASFVGKAPEKFVSENAARQLAMASYQRGRKLMNDSAAVVGIGASCALAKANERKGRDHKICIAYQTRLKTGSITLKLPHIGREHEERLASHLILRMLGDAVGKTEGNWIHTEYDEGLVESQTVTSADYNISQVLHGALKYHYYKPLTEARQHSVIFPGSFNPLHEGHKEIIQIAQDYYHDPVLCEISITNVDKAPLDYTEIKTRAEQFDKDLVFTNAPLVVEKARLFPNSIFLVGADSWNRILDKKYYDNSETKKTAVLNELKSLHATFMVFPRMVNGAVIRLEDNDGGLAFPAPKTPVHLDMSSTQIRAIAKV